MRFLDLVEQDDLIRPPSHRLGELAAGLVPDVSRRRPDETRDRVRFRVLGEIEPCQRVLVEEEHVGDGLRRLGLAHPGGPEQKEGSDGAA